MSFKNAILNELVEEQVGFKSVFNAFDTVLPLTRDCNQAVGLGKDVEEGTWYLYDLCVGEMGTESHFIVFPTLNILPLTERGHTLLRQYLELLQRRNQIEQKEVAA